MSTMPHSSCRRMIREDAGDDEDHGEDPQESSHAREIAAVRRRGIGSVSGDLTGRSASATRPDR